VAITRSPNREQEEYWNGEEACHGVSHVDRYDAMLEPFNAHLFGRAVIQRTDAVVDIGCGCGVTTLAAAVFAPEGLALGIDLSAPMLEVAAGRAGGRSTTFGSNGVTPRPSASSPVTSITPSAASG
jgi:tRNA G46 methylase TrmB